MTLIKSPNRSGETSWFCSISSSSSLFSFFFLPKFCPHKFSVTTGRIGLKFGDIVNMIRKLCKRITKGSHFKIADSKAPSRACQNLPKFCPDEFSVTTRLTVLKFEV